MLSILLALVSSLAFAMSTITINRGLAGMDYMSGLVVNLVTNALLLWLVVAVFSLADELWVSGNVIFVVAGLLVPGLARLFLFKGMERVGASIASTMLNASPLCAIVFAFFFLAERPTLTNLTGALFVVAGIAFLSWRGVTKTWNSSDLIFPVAAAFLFAVRDNLVRYGLLIVRSPIIGATIAATTSALTIGLFYFVAFGGARWAQANQSGVRYFAASGFLNFIAYVTMYTALSLDRVSVVSPLVNCSSLFVLPLAYCFLKDIEKITPRKIFATLFVIVGVVLISWEKI